MNIDWSVFDKYPEDDVYCKCGTIYKTHTKMLIYNSKLTLVTRIPCPSCKCYVDHVMRVSSEKEVFNISS